MALLPRPTIVFEQSVEDPEFSPNEKFLFVRKYVLDIETGVITKPFDEVFDKTEKPFIFRNTNLFV